MPIQDEKVSINDILVEKNYSLREEINKKLSENKVQSRIIAAKLIFDKSNIFRKDELIEMYRKLARDENDQVKSVLIYFLIHDSGKILQTEVRNELINEVLNNTNNIKIKNAVKDFFMTSNENNRSNELKLSDSSDLNTQTYPINYSNLNQSISEKKYNIRIENSTLEEYILCVTLWMGGDGAIFNSSEIAYYLPFNEEEIKFSLEKLKSKNILIKRNNDYILTEKGSNLADSSLIKIIATWYNFSKWIDNPNYSTVHHGFLKDKKNIAISNLFLSSRSFITDFFQVTLENIAKFYNNKNISYFTEFRTLLIWIYLNPTIDFFNRKNNYTCCSILNDFLHDNIIKVVDYNQEKIILMDNEYFKRKHKKATKLEGLNKW